MLVIMPHKNHKDGKKKDILDPVLQQQERMEVWKAVLEKQILLHHQQIKVVKKISHTTLNKNKRIQYFPHHSTGNEKSELVKESPACRHKKRNSKDHELKAIGRSLPLALRPRRVYPAYFVPWQWKAIYSGGILKLNSFTGKITPASSKSAQAVAFCRSCDKKMCSTDWWAHKEMNRDLSSAHDCMSCFLDKDYAEYKKSYAGKSSATL